MAKKTGNEPSGLGEVFDRVSDNVCDLHFEWQEYQHLFGQQETIDFLNKASAPWSRMLHGLFVHSTMLGIARLCDPQSQGKFENLSLERAINTLPDHALSDQLEKRLDSIRTKAEAVIHWRMKRIAHSDLDHSVGAKKLPTIEKKQIEEVLTEIRDFMKSIWQHYLNMDFFYEEIVSPPTGDWIVFSLGQAQRLRDLEEKCVRCEITPEELFNEVKYRTYDRYPLP